MTDPSDRDSGRRDGPSDDADVGVLDRFETEVESLQNVVGVGRNGDKVVALVERKVPEDELPDDQIIARRTSVQKPHHEVIEVGNITPDVLDIGDTAPPGHDPSPVADTTLVASDDARSGIDVDAETAPQASRSRQVYDPVQAGAEIQPSGKSWVGTDGVCWAVKNTRRGGAIFDDDVERGDVVRLSNWHVFVGDEYDPGREIHQPFSGRVVGEVCGRVPIQHGGVDVAARTVTGEDGWGVVDLPTSYGREYVYAITPNMVGETVIKSGRTTGVTSGQIRVTNARITIDYGGAAGNVRFSDVILTDRMGDSGDSGAPVFRERDGALISKHFAGSSRVSCSIPVYKIIRELGVEPITDWDPAVPPAEYVDTPGNSPVTPPGQGGGGRGGGGGGGNGNGKPTTPPGQTPDEPTDPAAPEEPDDPADPSGPSGRSWRHLQSAIADWFRNVYGADAVDVSAFNPAIERYPDIVVRPPTGPTEIVEIATKRRRADSAVGQAVINAAQYADARPVVVVPNAEWDDPDFGDVNHDGRVEVRAWPRDFPDDDDASGA